MKGESSMKVSDKNQNVIFRMFFKIAARHAGAIGIYVFIFLLLTFWITGSARQTEKNMFSASQLNVCIIDQDNSEASAALYDYIASRHHIITLPDNNTQGIEDNLYYRYIDYVLTIPKGFADRLQKSDAAGLLSVQTVPGSANSRFIDEQIKQYLLSIQMQLAGGMSLSDALSSTNDLLGKLPGTDIIASAKDVNTQAANTSLYYYLRYLPYILLNVIVLGVGIVLTIFRRKDFSNRIHCSSISSFSYERQLISACIAFSLGIWLFFIVIGALLYAKGINGIRPLFGIINSLVFSLVCLSIAYLSSSLSLSVKTGISSTVTMFANVVSLGMSFLCGIFVSQELLGAKVLMVAHFLPAYWYIRLNSMLAGFSTEKYNPETVILCLGVEILFIFANLSVAAAIDKRRR